MRAASRSFGTIVAFCILILGAVPAWAGHWEISYAGAGTVTLGSQTYPWPPVPPSPNGSYFVGGSGIVNPQDNAVGSGAGAITTTLTWVDDGVSPFQPP